MTEPPIPLSADTQRVIDCWVPEGDRDSVRQLLETRCGAGVPLWSGKTPAGLERLRFAALKLGAGSPAQLQRAVELANIDWRDVLVAAGFGHDPLAHRRWFDEHVGPRPAAR